MEGQVKKKKKVKIATVSSSHKLGVQTNPVLIIESGWLVNKIVIRVWFFEVIEMANDRTKNKNNDGINLWWVKKQWSWLVNYKIAI